VVIGCQAHPSPVSDVWSPMVPIGVRKSDSPKGGEGCRFKLTLSSPLWGSGAGSEGVK